MSFRTPSWTSMFRLYPYSTSILPVKKLLSLVQFSICFQISVRRKGEWLSSDASDKISHHGPTPNIRDTYGEIHINAGSLLHMSTLRRAPTANDITQGSYRKRMCTPSNLEFVKRDTFEALAQKHNAGDYCWESVRATEGADPSDRLNT